MSDILVAAVIAMSHPQAPAVDTTVCYQVDGQWRSDYSESGACTFGGPLNDVTGIEEDDPRWDCRTMGNRECGPDNAQGVPGRRLQPLT
jgi:hypothetical protein